MDRLDEEDIFGDHPHLFDALDWKTARDVYAVARGMTVSDDEITESVLVRARGVVEDSYDQAADAINADLVEAFPEWLSGERRPALNTAPGADGAPR